MAATAAVAEGQTAHVPLLPQCGTGLREMSAGADSCSDHSCPPSGKSAYNCFTIVVDAGVRRTATNARIKRNQWEQDHSRGRENAWLQQHSQSTEKRRASRQ